MNARACSRVGRYAPESRYNKCALPEARIQKFFKGGGVLRRKIFKEKCLLIHLSSRVHIKTRQTCNSFSLLPFQEDCLLFFALFYYTLLFLKFEKGGGGCNPPPTLYAPMLIVSYFYIYLGRLELYRIRCKTFDRSFFCFL